MKYLVVLISLLFTAIKTNAVGQNVPLRISSIGDYNDSPPIRHAPPES